MRKPETSFRASSGSTRQKHLLARALQPVRALGRSIVFFLKVFPMLPSRPVDWVTKAPVVERVRYPTCQGFAEGDLYRPAGDGPHPGILVCLGVVPFEVNHPQVPVLGRALARAGLTALLYWSPSMRDFRMDPEDLENIPLAYDWLISQPNVDAGKSGMLGTCVGGAFALMAAAHPLVNNRVGFIAAYAPYASMWTFARDIAAGRCTTSEGRMPWKVDQLTRRVYVHSLTAPLDPQEAERLRAAFAKEGCTWDGGALSADGQSVYALLTASSEEEADAALHRLPPVIQQRLTALSPLTHLDQIRSPLIVQLHDVGDQVIPISESRQLQQALQGRPGVQYTEMRFSHLDPVKGKLPLTRLIKELWKFFIAVYPLFRLSVE